MKEIGHKQENYSGRFFIQATFARARMAVLLVLFIGIFLILPAGMSQAQVAATVQRSNPTLLPSKSLKTIIVADYYPYTFVNNKGVPDGFSVDVAKAAARIMDLDLDIRVDTWEHATRALSDGTIDLLPMMAYSPERDKLYDFSAPHTIAYDAIFVRNGAKRIGSLEDLVNKTIIVMNKDAAHQYLLSSGMAVKMKLILVDSLPDALRALAAGKGDAALMPKLVGLIIMKQLNLTNLDPSPAVIGAYNRPFSIAVREGNQVLLERLTQGLSIIKSTGQYQEIYKKWFGAVEQPGLPWNTAIKYIASVAAVFLLTALGLIIWNTSLRKRVASQTKHLTVEIEERKRSEEALRRNEKDLKESQRIAHVGSWRLDIATNQVVWTEELYNMYGFDPFLPPPPYTEHMKLFTPESWERLSTALARTRDTGIPYTLELETVRKDGSNGWMWVRGEADVDSAGKTVGLWGAAQDITDRKRMELALSESEKRFREIAETINEVFWVGSADWSEVYYVSSAYERIWGRTVQSLYEQPLSWLDALHPDDREAVRMDIDAKSHGRSATPDFTPYRVLRPDGSIRWIFAKAFPILNPDGQVTHIVGIAEDITERKQVEEDLKSSEDLYHAIFEQAGDGVFIMDTKGKILSINEKFAQIHGFTVEEMLRMGLEALDVEGTKPVPDRLRRIMAGEILTFEVEHLHKEGHTFSLQVTANLISVGKEKLIMNIHRDISDRKHTEEAINLHLAVMETVAEGVFIIGVDDNIIKWTNRKFEKMFGYNPGEMVGMHVDRVNAPTERTATETRISIVDLLLERGEWQGEIKNIKKDGTHFWCFIYVSLFDHPQFGKVMVSAHTDITERKQADETLRQERERMAGILRGTNTGTWEWNVQTGETIFNERWAEIIGYTLDEISPVSIETWKRFCHQDDLKFSDEQLTKHFRGELDYYECEARMRHKNSSWVWVLDRGRVTSWSEDGKPLMMMGTHQDITERKCVEEALKESEAKYRKLLENINDIVWETDSQGCISYINEQSGIHLGYAPEEMIGKPVWEFLNPATLEHNRNEFAKALKVRDHIITMENEFIHKNGSSVFVETKASAIFNSDGVWQGFKGIDRNITERKRSEEERFKYEASLSAIMSSTTDWIWSVDAESFGLLSFNPALKDYFSKTAGIDIQPGMTLDVLLSAERVPIWEDFYKRAVSDGMYQTEYHALRSAKTFLLSFNSMKRDGKVFAVSAFGKDITERKHADEERARLQEQLLQAQKMESIGRLAGGVAHDFNNMLGVIIGHAEMAMENFEPSQPIHRDLKEIHKAAQRSAVLTGQLLAFARKQTVAPRVLDLNKTIEGMSKMLQRIIGEDIDLALLPGDGLWPVNIDPSQIDQILANLCVNARDAIAGVGKIIIETANITFDDSYCRDHAEFVPGNYVQLVVSDNGCGMNQEILAKIFEPFFTTKEAGKGTGLGLSTVYGIVKQNKGFINIYSEPDHGTTVKIYLPRHIGKSEASTGEGSQLPAARGRETILVVEDEPALLKMGRRMLEKQGYNILSAATPGEALLLAREHHGNIDLLMTDVIMPEMNGRELAKNILSLYPDIKCLFTSGYTADVIAHHGVLDEGVHFLQKPFSTNTLTAKIREVLNGNA